MADSNPKVSIVVTAFQGERFAEGLVANMQLQTMKDFECLIVDDGSTDGTVAAYERLTQEDPRFRVLAKPAEGNAGLARRYGIARAKGEYVAIMDHDDLWHEDFLARVVKVLDEHPECGVCYTRHRIFLHGETPDVRENLPVEAPEINAQHLQQLSYGNNLSMSATLFRLKLVREIGGFGRDKALLNCEDYYTHLSYARVTAVAIIPTVLNFYRMHPTNKSRNPEKMVRGLHRIADLLGEDGAPEWLQRRVRAQALFSEAKVNLTRAPGQAWRQALGSLRNHRRGRTFALLGISLFGLVFGARLTSSMFGSVLNRAGARGPGASA